MIVLPLIEEARSSRRPPWVTLVVVAACVVVFLHHQGTDREVDAATDAAIEEMWTYFAARPYVKVDEDVASMLGEDEVAIASQTFLQQLRASGSPGIPDFVRHHDQVDFDHKVELVYEAMESHSFYRLGFFPDALSDPDASFLTYVLVHEDWLHLLPNLALVLLAGLFLEQVWGRGVFLVFVLTGSIAGALGYAVLDPEAGEALGGASGLAAALAGAFLVRFATVPIRFQYFLIPPFGGKFTARGWVTLPIYGGLYVVADYLLTHGAPGIEPVSAEFATWAHVGGMVWGIAFAAGMKALRIEERFIHPQIEKKLTTRSNPLLDRALEAREDGRTEEALELLVSEVARHPENRDAALAYWDAATAVGRPGEAAAALASVLRDEVASGQKELAVQHWSELTQRVPEFQLESAVEVRVAGLLIESGEFDLAAFSMRRLLEGSCGAVSGTTALRLARMAQDVDSDVALRAAQAALASSDLEPPDVADVQRLVEQLQSAGEAELDTAAAAAAEQANGESSPLFDRGGYDLDDCPVDDADAEVGETLEVGEAGASGATGGGAAEGPDLDGDALNAPPFELEDASEPPGVRNYDLAADDSVSGGASLAGAAPPGADASPESNLPGVAEIPLDDDIALPLDDDAALPLDDDTALPLDDDIALPLDDDAALPLDDAAALPLDDDTAPSLDQTPDPVGLTPDPGRSIPELDRSTPDLGSSGPDLGPTMPVVEARPQGTTQGTPSPDSAEPSPELEHAMPELESGEPDFGVSVPEFSHSSPDLGESAPDLAVTMPPGVAVVDEGILLEDESVGHPRPLPVDDTDVPDFGNTMDMASLGAETIPGLGDDPLPGPSAPPQRPAAIEVPEIEAPPPPRSLKKMEAIPLALGADAMTLDVGERGKAQLALGRIDAISVAGVRGLRPKPVVVIDLVTNWLGGDRQPLKIVRLRSDRFDPCNLIPGEDNGFHALKIWLAQLLERTGAMALPDVSSVVGEPFQMYENLADYEREVLRIL